MSTAFTNLQAVPLDAALPTQNTNTSGKALTSNGTNCGWNTVLSMIGPGPGQSTGGDVANAILPIQAGSAGKVLATDGNGTLSWVTSSAAVAGVSSISISGTSYTGAVTIVNVPSATTATNVSGTVAVANGGTGATTAVQALTKLGAAAFNHSHNYSPSDSPTFTGVPSAPTADPGANSTQIATTAFVTSAIANFTLVPGGVGSIALQNTQTAPLTGTWVFIGQIGDVGNTATGLYLYQRIS